MLLSVDVLKSDMSVEIAASSSSDNEFIWSERIAVSSAVTVDVVVGGLIFDDVTDVEGVLKIKYAPITVTISINIITIERFISSTLDSLMLQKCKRCC